MGKAISKLVASHDETTLIVDKAFTDSTYIIFDKKSETITHYVSGGLCGYGKIDPVENFKQLRAFADPPVLKFSEVVQVEVGKAWNAGGGGFAIVVALKLTKVIHPSGHLENKIKLPITHIGMFEMSELVWMTPLAQAIADFLGVPLVTK